MTVDRHIELQPTDDTTRIILVRHGATEWNARDVYQGWEDIPLDTTGLAQAQALAELLASVEIDAAYTSPLVRARETARIVLGGRGVMPLVVRDLRELSYGRLTGMTPAERRVGYASLEDRWLADPWSVEF
ncbi:MAG TPA: histidine phosphatase family protein, partial [Gemmatimonadaceae bacterium]